MELGPGFIDEVAKIFFPVPYSISLQTIVALDPYIGKQTATNDNHYKDDQNEKAESHEIQLPPLVHRPFIEV